jgi:pilus assembly protein CpaB
MPIRSLLLGLIAVSALVIMGIFLQSMFATQQAEQPAAPPKQVLVAAADMPHGRLLRPEDVRWQPSDRLPAASVANALATQVGGPSKPDAHSLGDILGAITRRDLKAGEVLEVTDVVKPGDRDFLPAVLTPGLRAITVSVATLSGSSAGLIYPGDHVDVILSQQLHEPNLPVGRRTVAEIFAQDLRVLAIDHYTQGGQSGDPNGPQLRNAARTVTLETSPEMATKIEAAADLGKLSLILRSLDAGDPPKMEDAIAWGEDVSPALRQVANIAPAADNKGPAAPAAPRQVIIYRGDQVGHGGE